MRTKMAPSDDSIFMAKLEQKTQSLNLHSTMRR